MVLFVVGYVVLVGGELLIVCIVLMIGLVVLVCSGWCLLGFV